jgi:hypothetical protein
LGTSPDRYVADLVRDKGALRASVEEIRRREFDRVIVAHEGVVETGGKAAFAAATAWLDR